MSIVQLVGSSRAENLVYFFVSSVFIVALMKIAGIVEPTIEGNLIVVIPFSSIIGLPLMILKLERKLTSKVTKHKLGSGKGGNQVKYFMAFAVIAYRPWRASWSGRPGISSMLDTYIRRVNDSPFLRNQFYRVEGAVLLLSISFPLTYVFNLDIVLSFLSLLSMVLLACYLIYESRELPMTLRHVLVTWWLRDMLEQISHTAKSHEDFITPDGQLGEKLIHTINRLKSLDVQIIQQDWEGVQIEFLELYRDLDNLIFRESITRTYEWLLYDYCETFLYPRGRFGMGMWAGFCIQDAFNTLARIFMVDSLDDMKIGKGIWEIRERNFNNIKSIVRLLRVTVTITDKPLTELPESRFAYLKLPAKYHGYSGFESHFNRPYVIYTTLSVNEIRNASESAFKILLNFAQRYYGAKKGDNEPKWSRCSDKYEDRVEQLACNMIQCVETEMWDVNDVLPTLLEWKVDFTRLIPVMKQRTLEFLLVSNHGLAPYTIRRLLPHAIQHCGQSITDTIVAIMTDEKNESEHGAMKSEITKAPRGYRREVGQILDRVEEVKQQTREDSSSSLSDDEN